MTEYLTTDARGLAVSLHRQARAMDPYQWVRELCWNVPAGGAEVRICADVVEGRPVIAVRDNGPGFEGKGSIDDDLRRHIKTLHYSGQNNDGDRYGLGGRVSTVPFNPGGVSFVSRRPDGSEAWVKVIETGGGFGLQEARIEGENHNVFAPLKGMFERWQAESGTSVFLHGDGHIVDYNHYRISQYLQQRMFELPGTLEAIGVHEPTGYRKFTGTSDIIERNAQADGWVSLGGGVDAYWYVLAEELTGHTNEHRGLHTIAVLDSSEIYNRPTGGNSTASRYGHFGIALPKIRRRILILVDVSDHDDFWPNHERSRIVTLEDRDLPWAEWGATFRANMPEPIAALIEQAWEDTDDDQRRRIAARLDPEYLKRMAPRLTLSRDPDGVENITVIEPLPSEGTDTGTSNGDGEPLEPIRRAVVRREGEQRGRKREQRDLPRTEWIDRDEWIATEDDGGHGQHEYTLGYINGSVIFLHRQFEQVAAMKAFWAARHPEVPNSIIDVSVEYAVALLATAKYVYGVFYAAERAQTKETVNRDMFIDAELFTVALGGLVDVDAIVEHDLQDRVRAARL